MANKTVEKISPDTFWDEIKAINNKAKEAAIDLLNKQGDNRYIVVMDWEDYYTEYYTNQAAISVSVFGVGLNEDNNLCIAATVDNQGYGCSKNDFEQDWVEVSELFRPCYALLYGFVANNIDKAVTKEEADRLAKKYWNGDGHDYGKYDWQDDFKNGFAKVELDGKTGFINEDGEEVIPCKYDGAWNFSEGLVSVETEGLWGFVNENGDEIVPFKYDLAWSFSEGLAGVKTEDRWGFINKAGEEIVPCKYENVNSFEEGFARVFLNEKYGFINKTGNIVVPLKYDYAVNCFTNGYVKVCLDEKWGVCNVEGKEVIPCKYYSIGAFKDVGNPEGKSLAFVETKDKVGGLYDLDGNELQPCIYDQAEDFCNGMARVMIDGKWGYLDATGALSIPLQYEDAEDFEDGTARVQQNGEWITIDKTGKQVSD